MPRKSTKATVQPVEAPAIEAPPVQPTNETPTTVSKEDYIHARSVIKQWRETKKTQPKRKCTDKQLAALAAGRERNKRFAKKQADQ